MTEQMKKSSTYRRMLALITIVFLFSCYEAPRADSHHAALGFYSSPEQVIDALKGKPQGAMEHFMLGIAYKKLKENKRAIFHFANSCFTYKRDPRLKLFAIPVFKFIDGFHFKSDYYDDAAFEIGGLFYLYNEFTYTVKFMDLLKSRRSALYRNAMLLKAKALVRLKRYQQAADTVTDIDQLFEDIDSRSIIKIRLGSIYEKMKSPAKALKCYLAVIAISHETWQARLAATRIDALMATGGGAGLTGADRLAIARVMHAAGKWELALRYLNDRTGTESESGALEAACYRIRLYTRLNNNREADALMAAAKDSRMLRALTRARADELWNLKRRAPAADLYQKIDGTDDDALHALKRFSQYTERAKRSGFEDHLHAFTQRFPRDPYAEYALWLLAKSRLKEKKFEQAVPYLQKALADFPNGSYTDRVRFWLYKINAGKPESEKIVRDMAAFNPGSVYTWMLLERTAANTGADALESEFAQSAKNTGSNDCVYYHMLLLLKQRSIEKSQERIKKIRDNAIVRDYLSFEKKYMSAGPAGTYKELLAAIERYFRIGHLEAINREITIIPDSEATARDKFGTLMNLGHRYGNPYLAVYYTLQLMQTSKLSENAALCSTELLKRLYPRPFKGCMQKYATKYAVTQDLLFAVTKAESLFHHSAVSSAGAVGLMQLMPFTAKGIARQMRLEQYDLKDPCTSIEFGAKYLAWLSAMFKGNVDYMIGSYNAGAGNIQKWLKRMPYTDQDLFVEMIPFEETRFYIFRIRKFLILYGALQ